MNTEKLTLAIVRAEGAIARDAGFDIVDNPYSRTETLPETSGGKLIAWEAQADAWESGWLCGCGEKQ